MGLTDQLLAFARTPVPDKAAAMMRLSLFDWAACGIAGAREPAYAAFVAAQSAPGAATVLGGGKSAAPVAALVNGTLSHALDYDDTHFAHIGHPSVAVVPAVLALAEETGASLEDVVAAATIGVEASIGVGVWLGRGHYQIGFHQTATAGAFGAVLAGCRLLDMTEAETRAALGLCASMASGVKAQFGTMAKPLNAGLAARTGVEAARWARAGTSAALDGLDGPSGFGATHHAERGAVTFGREQWRIEEISHKFHACCHGLHAMLEALSALDETVGDIRCIEITTHPRWMSVCNIPTPQTGLEAKFSYRQTAAMALLGHDTGAIASYTDAVTQAPDVVALRDRINVLESSKMPETKAFVQVHLHGGQVHEVAYDLLTPMAFDMRSAKLRKKAEALLGQDRSSALWDAAQGAELEVFCDQLVRS